MQQGWKMQDQSSMESQTTHVMYSHLMDATLLLLLVKHGHKKLTRKQKHTDSKTMTTSLYAKRHHYSV